MTCTYSYSFPVPVIQVNSRRAGCAPSCCARSMESDAILLPVANPAL
ncbi:MAG TPA: hypothetical protein VNO70_13270 [Blastocatellia bacterium]|nr:hypothetical protein [Blastocatellia bacterium]